MKPSVKRILSVFLIICVSLGIGFAVDAIWNFADRQGHPTDYGEMIKRYAAEYNLPDNVIFAVIKVESDFDPNARSGAGAMGLMQMMPSTFEWLTGDEHLGEHLSTQCLFDPEVSIRYGTYYLAYLYRKFDHNWHNTFAAYNGGEGNVAKWLKEANATDENGNLTYIPFDETRSYVSKVERAVENYKKLYPAE